MSPPCPGDDVMPVDPPSLAGIGYDVRDPAQASRQALTPVQEPHHLRNQG